MNLAGTANRQVWMHGWSFQYQVCQLSKYSGGSVLRYMWRLTLKKTIPCHWRYSVDLWLVGDEKSEGRERSNLSFFSESGSKNLMCTTVCLVKKGG